MSTVLTIFILSFGILLVSLGYRFWEIHIGRKKVPEENENLYDHAYEIKEKSKIFLKRFLKNISVSSLSSSFSNFKNWLRNNRLTEKFFHLIDGKGTITHVSKEGNSSTFLSGISERKKEIRENLSQEETVGIDQEEKS